MSYGYRGMAGIGNFKPDMVGMAAPAAVAPAAPPPMQPVDNRMGSRARRQSPYVQALRRNVGAGAPPQYMAGGNQFGLSGFSVPTMAQLGLEPPAQPAAPQAAPQQPSMGMARLQQLMAQQRGAQMGGLGMGGYNPYRRR